MVQRCAGINVSKRDGAVCVRVEGAESRRTSSQVTTWSSSMPAILRLRDKLVQIRSLHNDAGCGSSLVCASASSSTWWMWVSARA